MLFTVLKLFQKLLLQHIYFVLLFLIFGHKLNCNFMKLSVKFFLQCFELSCPIVFGNFDIFIDFNNLSFELAFLIFKILHLKIWKFLHTSPHFYPCTSLVCQDHFSIFLTVQNLCKWKDTWFYTFSFIDPFLKIINFGTWKNDFILNIFGL